MVTPDKAGQVRVAAQALVETDFIEHVNKEKASEQGRFTVTYEKIQQWLIRGLRSDTTLTAEQRAECGISLAHLGDPRFDSEYWYLPREPLFGFLPIPAGPFLMGSDKKQDAEASDDELKQHHVDLPTYYVARWPVTVAQFRAFVQEENYAIEDADALKGSGNHPVVLVSWDEALAYCQWLQERLSALAPMRLNVARSDEERDFWHGLMTGNLKGGLPSEAEWEKAARGTDGRIYPWGDKPDPNRANDDNSNIKCELRT